MGCLSEPKRGLRKAYRVMNSPQRCRNGLPSACATSKICWRIAEWRCPTRHFGVGELFRTDDCGQLAKASLKPHTTTRRRDKADERDDDRQRAAALDVVREHDREPGVCRNHAGKQHPRPAARHPSRVAKVRRRLASMPIEIATR